MLALFHALGDADLELTRQERHSAYPTHVHAYRIVVTFAALFLLVALLLGALDRQIDLGDFGWPAARGHPVSSRVVEEPLLLVPGPLVLDVDPRVTAQAPLPGAQLRMGCPEPFLPQFQAHCSIGSRRAPRCKK